MITAHVSTTRVYHTCQPHVSTTRVRHTWHYWILCRYLGRRSSSSCRWSTTTSVRCRLIWPPSLPSRSSSPLALDIPDLPSLFPHILVSSFPHSTLKPSDYFSLSGDIFFWWLMLGIWFPDHVRWVLRQNLDSIFRFLFWAMLGLFSNYFLIMCF